MAKTPKKRDRVLNPKTKKEVGESVPGNWKDTVVEWAGIKYLPKKGRPKND